MLRRFGMLLLTFVVGFVVALPIYLGVHYFFGLAEIEGYHIKWHETLHDVCQMVIMLMFTSAVMRKLFGKKASDTSGKSPA